MSVFDTNGTAARMHEMYPDLKIIDIDTDSEYMPRTNADNPVRKKIQDSKYKPHAPVVALMEEQEQGLWAWANMIAAAPQGEIYDDPEIVEALDALGN